MAATARLWSSVGSAGAVNPPDIGKVVLVGPIAQLGELGGVVSGSPKVAARGAGPGTQAVIRYGVTAVDGAFNPIPNGLVGLAILCRPGDGQIAARLVQVAISGQPVSSVVETTLVEFQAQPGDPKLFSQNFYIWPFFY